MNIESMSETTIVAHLDPLNLIDNDEKRTVKAVRIRQNRIFEDKPVFEPSKLEPKANCVPVRTT